MTGVFVPVGAYANAYVGYVIQGNGCWDWTGSITDRGYGKIGVNKRIVYAHRFMHEKTYGPIPEGLVLDHFACENKRCVNPDHVRPVSQRENTLRADSPASWAASRTHCPYGHKYPLGELNRNKRGYRECPECPTYWGKRHRRQTTAA